MILAPEMSVAEWAGSEQHSAEARQTIFAPDGSAAEEGAVGEVCDYLPSETSDGGYVVVDFPETGPLLCRPDEIGPVD